MTGYSGLAAKLVFETHGAITGDKPWFAVGVTGVFYSARDNGLRDSDPDKSAPLQEDVDKFQDEEDRLVYDLLSENAKNMLRNQAVIQMSLCEVPFIRLRPNQVYLFTVEPGCEKCEKEAAPYLNDKNQNLVALESSCREPMVRLIFIPQMWVNDYGVEVAPEGETVWSVPLREILDEFPTRESWVNEHENRDNLHYHANAPIWIREWSGPFEVEFEDPFTNPWEVIESNIKG